VAAISAGTYQTGNSHLCSAMWNFSFFVGFIKGTGLNRNS